MIFSSSVSIMFFAGISMSNYPVMRVKFKEKGEENFIEKKVDPEDATLQSDNLNDNASSQDTVEEKIIFKDGLQG